jgi:hypothetical protein
MKDRSRYEQIRENIIKDIADIKASPAPDKKALKLLARRLIKHEEDACDFTGRDSDSKPKRQPSGKRSYKYAKWVSDDERYYS